MRTLLAVPNTELCTSLPLNWEHLSKQDSELGPNGVVYREVPLYTGRPTGSQWCPPLRGSTVYAFSVKVWGIFTANPASYDWSPKFWCLKSPHSSCLVLIVARPRGLDNNGNVLGWLSAYASTSVYRHMCFSEVHTGETADSLWAGARAKRNV